MKRSNWIAVIAAGSAVVIAAVIVIVVLTTSGDGELTPRQSADLSEDERDAVWSCTLVEQLPESFEKDDFKIDEPAIHQATAAGALASAAARAGSEWEEFDQHGDDLMTASATLNLDDFNDSMDTLRTLCEDVEPVLYLGEIELACDILDAIPDDLAAALENDPIKSPVLWRMMGVGGLGYAAQYGDDPAESFSEPAIELMTAAQTLDIGRAVDAAPELRTYCADLD